MEFLGIGPLELLFIIVIAVIVLGPEGMVKAAREVGQFIRKVVKSPLWRDVMDTSQEIRDLPQKIAREAGIEEDLDDLRRTTQGTIYEMQKPAFTELPTHPKPSEKPPQKSSKKIEPVANPEDDNKTQTGEQE